MPSACINILISEENTYQDWLMISVHKKISTLKFSQTIAGSSIPVRNYHIWTRASLDPSSSRTLHEQTNPYVAVDGPTIDGKFIIVVLDEMPLIANLVLILLCNDQPTNIQYTYQPFIVLILDEILL